MKDLMIAVERAVRPVRAGFCRKMRMREELLAHLTAAFEQERARLGDEQQALAEALRRFGDPAEISRELQRSVPLVERILQTPVRRLRKTSRRRSGPSGRPWWRRVSLLLYGLALWFFPILLLQAHGVWHPASISLLLGFFSSIAQLLALYLLARWLSRQMTGRFCWATLLRTAAFGAALCALLSGLHVWLFWFDVGDRLRLRLPFVFLFGLFLQISFMFAVVLFAFAFILRLAAGTNYRLQPWTELDLGD